MGISWNVATTMTFWFCQWRIFPNHCQLRGESHDEDVDVMDVGLKGVSLLPPITGFGQ